MHSYSSFLELQECKIADQDHSAFVQLPLDVMEIVLDFARTEALSFTCKLLLKLTGGWFPAPEKTSNPTIETITFYVKCGVRVLHVNVWDFFDDDSLENRNTPVVDWTSTSPPPKLRMIDDATHLIQHWLPTVLQSAFRLHTLSLSAVDQEKNIFSGSQRLSQLYTLPNLRTLSLDLSDSFLEDDGVSCLLQLSRV
eukprot:TRINITY_DN66619_c1_g14_i1.p1 TRINITY_DN66619_c1_g14~~TRINITY_DN66619_c1_g14_i1.p1  ORF type:complete len:196 (+),score=9.02 TRINITY_DN66619_c1_g14_i1:64-651(+)